MQRTDIHTEQSPADPLAAYFQRLRVELVQDVTAGILAQLQQGPVDVDAPEPLRADAYYTAKDLARRWYHNDEKGPTNRVHGISELELPRTRVGPKRGTTLFYGLSILRYEGHVSEAQYNAIQKAKLPLLASAPKEPTRLRRHGHALDQNHQ